MLPSDVRGTYAPGEINIFSNVFLSNNNDRLAIKNQFAIYSLKINVYNFDEI